MQTQKSDPLETKNKILSILRFKGPSLPIHIATQTKISSIFAGAFLSELANEDAIKISNIKVGGSPLYYIKGQESMLDSFYKYLPEKEREAFLSLKQNKILEDRKQEPAIRVALRSIKDFAFPFKKDEEIFWRFHSTTEQEVRDILEPKVEESSLEKNSESQNSKNLKSKDFDSAQKSSISDTSEKTAEADARQATEGNEKKEKIEEIKEKEESIEKVEEQPVKKEEIKVSKPRIQTKKDRQLDIGLKIAKKPENKKPKKQEFQERFENPLVIPDTIKEKPRSPFVQDLIEKISKKYKIVEEKYYKPKEYSCIVQVNSDLGPINFLAFANDKKKLSETDLRKMLSEAQKIPLPALVLHKGEVSKKAIDYSKAYFSILKVEKI